MKKVTCPTCRGHGFYKENVPCGYCNAKGYVCRATDVPESTRAQDSNNTNDEIWRQGIFDLDGVLARSLWPFADEDIPNFPVVERAAETLRKVKEAGYRIIIWTARSQSLEDVTRKWLEKNGIPYDELWMEKPPFTFFVDDRAVNFDGSWDGLAERLTSYQTWLEVERDGVRSFATELALRQRDERVRLYNQNKANEPEDDWDQEAL